MKRITASVNDVFNFLTAYAEKPNYKPLLVAPRDLAKTCIALIDREARNAKRGRPARIIAKMNALVDPPVIQALYRASQAGVEIDLIVRGQCALVPGLARSEQPHPRAQYCGKISGAQPNFLFWKCGQPEIYLGSADWMQRNLVRTCGSALSAERRSICGGGSRKKFCRPIWRTRERRGCLDADGIFTRSRAGRNGQRNLRAGSFDARWRSSRLLHSTRTRRRRSGKSGAGLY